MAVKIKERNGKYWLYIDYKGKRKAKKVGSEKAALDAAAKIEAKITLGQFEIKKEEKKRRPFDTYFEDWLNTYVKADCKGRTYDLYKAAFRLYLKPQFRQKDISEITRDEVKTWIYTLLGSGLKRGTVKTILIPLKAMFNQAVEDKHLLFNPALRILKRTRGEAAEKQRADFLTREEVGTLLRTCQEHFADYYPFLSTLARTGLRFGEATALQWGDVDFAGRFIDVRRTLSSGRLTTPKSGKSRRVDMSLQLTETLRAFLLTRKKETLRKGWGEVPSWVFISGLGTPLNSGNFHYWLWRPLLAKAKLRHIRVHDLRHTFASLLIQNGESLAYVKEQLGHSSIQITVDTYGHLVPGGNRQAVDRLDGLENTTIRNPDATTPVNTVSGGSVTA